MSGNRSTEQFLSGSPRKRLIKYELVISKAVFLMADLGLCNDALFDSAILHKMCFCSCFMCKNKSFCFFQELFH